VTLGLGLALLVLIGAIGGVTADLGSRQTLATMATAERVERTAQASTARMTAQAELYADAQRSAALDAALVAIAEAGDVAVVAVGVIQAEDVSPLDRAVTELKALVDAAAPVLPEPVAASGEQADPEPPAPPRTVAAGVIADIPPNPAPSLDDVPPAVQDLQISARMIELAAEVTDLTEQVRVLADAAAEELAAAQTAAAEQLAAAQAAAAEQAAAELARRVAAVDASPNGAVPHPLLCAVGFDSGVLLRCDAAAALEDLNTAFRARFGRDLSVSSSYRDYSTQVATREARGSLAAEPGTSNHGRGLAVDLDGFGAVGEFDRPYYRWMTDNARGFGWVHPAHMDPGGSGPLEPWHWEYGTH
jgi:LAS superfamily LD-carboxypeptidase LdcB